MSLIKQKANSHFNTHKSPKEDADLIKEEKKRQLT